MQPILGRKFKGRPTSKCDNQVSTQVWPDYVKKKKGQNCILDQSGIARHDATEFNPIHSSKKGLSSDKELAQKPPFRK